MGIARRDWYTAVRMSKSGVVRELEESFEEIAFCRGEQDLLSWFVENGLFWAKEYIDGLTMTLSISFRRSNARQHG
jgi:hypothetical protein